MITDVVSGGCSYTWGAELEDRDSRFVKIIANNFNANLHDTSMPGNCNQLICTDVVDKVLNLIHNKKILPEKIFVIINWTFLKRLPYYNHNNDTIESIKFKNIEDFEKLNKNNKLDVFIKKQLINNPSELDIKKYNVIKDWWYDHNHLDYLKYHFFNLLLYLEAFLTLNKVKNVFSFSDPAICELLILKKDKSVAYSDNHTHGVPHRTLIENILKTLNINCMYMGLNINRYKTKGFKNGPGDHPLEGAHAYFADELIDFIKERYPDVYVS